MALLYSRGFQDVIEKYCRTELPGLHLHTILVTRLVSRM